MKNCVLRTVLCGVLALCLLFGALPSGAEETGISISYEFGTLLAGRADGTVTVTGADTDAETAVLCWGTEDSLLAGYQPVADYSDGKVNKNGIQYTIVAPTGIPAGATHLWLVQDGELLASAEIPAERRVTEEKPLYRFGVLSDLHFGAGKAKESFVSAMDYFSSKGATFVLTAGDNTAGGTKAQWKEFADTYKSYDSMALWIALGNHDALAWNLSVTPQAALQNVRMYFPSYGTEAHRYGSDYTVTLSDEHPSYDYTMEYENDLYIMMGIGAASNDSENKNIDQRLSDGQISWLEECLKEHFSKADHGKVFLIFHYYTLESGMSVREGTEWDKSSSSRLHSLLNRYPGVIYFNGHTHFAFGKDVDSYAAQYASFHVPSLVYAGNFVKGEWESIGKQGYLVEVYDGYTLVNGIDFITGEKVASACYRLTDDFSDGVKTYGLSLRATAGGQIQWKAKSGGSKWTKLADIWDLKTDGSVQTISYNGESAIEFRANQTHIQWRLPGNEEDAWTDLVALKDIPEKPAESSSSEPTDSSPTSVSQEEPSSFPVGALAAILAAILCAGGAVAAVLLLKKKK